MTAEEHSVPGRYYLVRFTPGQLALVLACLHSQEDTEFDPHEIESRIHRDLVREALSTRRLAIKEMIKMLDHAVLSGIENQPELGGLYEEAV